MTFSSPLAFLVLSCDKYADLWPGFFHQLEKNFSTPHKKYLITNELNYSSDKTSNLQVIRNGKDTNWSDNLIRALDKIPEEKLFIILEDIYIDSPVNSEMFDQIEKFFLGQPVQHLKYMGNPKAEHQLDTLFSRYAPGMPYLASVNGIWDKAYLRALLIDGENAWDFEINASYRAKYSGEYFYALNTPLFSYRNMVEKGGWIKPNYEWAIKNHIPIEPQLRPIKSAIPYHLKRWYFDLMLGLPWRWRLKLGNLIKKLLIVY